MKVIETPEGVGLREHETDFLPRLAFRRCLRIRIDWFHASAGEGHVSGPRIPRSLRPLDEQQLGAACGILAVAQYDGDCRLGLRRVAGELRRRS
jgi:hypothetical protein